jgi:hypothetical protein
MEKTLKVVMWILIAVVAVMTIFAVGTIIQKKRDARSFAPVEFPETIVVENSTNYRADTICMHLAHNILGLDTFNLIIVYIPEVLNEGEMEYYAIVQYLPFKKNQFLILLNRDGLSLSKLKMALSHEFVHIDQYLRGDLVLYPLFAVWKGEDVYLMETPYEERPFEKEAFQYQGKYLKQLNKVLYD